MNVDAGRLTASRRPLVAGGAAERWIVAGAALLTAAVSVALAFPDALGRPFLLVGLAVIIPLPVVVRALQGKLDLLEPIVLLALGHLSLYLARPLAQLAYDQTGIGGIPITGAYDAALAVTLVGVVAVYAGYAFPSAERIAARFRPPPEHIPQRLTLIVAGFTLVIGLALWGVFLIQSGGLDSFFTYIQGRSTADKAAFRASSGYFYLAPFAAIPAALMLLDTNGRRHFGPALLVGVLCVLFILVITGPRGDRSFLLLLILPLLAQHYLRKQRRPPILAAVLSVLLAILVVNVLISYRRVEQRQGTFAETLTKSVTDPNGQAEQFFLGPDTTMFPLTVIAIETLDEHKPGSTITSLLASPVPGSLWESKPRDPDTNFYLDVFPEQAAVGDAGNALGYLGSYWYDGGYWTLVLYAFFSGLLFRVLYEYLRRYPGYTGAQLLFSICLPFAIVLIRGNPTQVFPVGLFIIFPVVALLFFAGRQQNRGGRTA